MARMAVGSSMLATIHTAPPQWTQVITSMPNALEALRPSHRAAAFVRWAVDVVRFAVSRGCIDGSPSAAPHGVTCERPLSLSLRCI